MRVTITFTLEGSPHSAEEAEQRMEAAINSYQLKGFSELVVDLLRTMRASQWSDLTVDVKEE
jgi:hypothetical protein